MSTFIQRIKKELNDPFANRPFGGRTVVISKDLQELIRNFERMDSDLREEVEAKDKRIAELESLCKECAEYININRCSEIGYGSILHKKLIEQASEVSK